MVNIWAQRYKVIGSIEPTPSGGSVSPLEEHAAFLLGLVEETPEMTLDEIVVAIKKAKILDSHTAVRRFYERHGIRLKEKTLYAEKQGRTEHARTRRR